MYGEKDIEHDYLTGLANRQALYGYYDSLDKDSIVHAMFIDIDNFKRVNDTYGHRVGDELLIAVSSLICRCTNGFASRIGGDEYVIILDGDIGMPRIVSIAKRLLENLHSIDFRKDILSLISLSIGIVMDQSANEDLDEVLAKCDAAMYHAKHNGKNQYSIYRSDDKVLEINRQIEAEMEPALENGEFIVYLQPVLNMISSGLVGAEARVRWAHPEAGIRKPDVFLPIFEKTGFISKLDMYIFEEVCRIKSTWKNRKYEHITVSVNMSRLHLYSKDFPKELVRIANKYDIPTSELEIEMKESVFLKDSNELINMIDILQAYGFKISIDDFGSGFSSFNLLKDLNANTIKINKDFFFDAFNSINGKKVLKSIIAMCMDLKMNVVTDGIEAKDQIEFVTRCGCLTGQGSYYAKPLPMKEFCEFADEYLTDIYDSITFGFDGNLKNDAGTMTAYYNSRIVNKLPDDADKSVGALPADSCVKYAAGIFKDSKSVYFPGGKVSENCIEISPDCIVNDSFTISAWIHPDELCKWTSAVFVQFENGFMQMVPYSEDGNSVCRIRDSRDISGWYDVKSVLLHENSWWHFAASYNAKTEKLTTFVNGEAVGQLENVPTLRYVKRIMIGGDIFQPSFKGNICEVVIYNEAKDSGFISELHQHYVTRDDFVGFEIDKPLYK